MQRVSPVNGDGEEWLQFILNDGNLSAVHLKQNATADFPFTFCSITPLSELRQINL